MVSGEWPYQCDTLHRYVDRACQSGHIASVTKSFFMTAQLHQRESSYSALFYHCISYTFPHGFTHILLIYFICCYLLKPKLILNLYTVYEYV